MRIRRRRGGKDSVLVGAREGEQVEVFFAAPLPVGVVKRESEYTDSIRSKYTDMRIRRVYDYVLCGCSIRSVTGERGHTQ